MRLPARQDFQSPNFGSRGGAPISMLVMHYTGMQSGKAALDRLCDAAAQVSAHYVVEEDGAVYSLVSESDCAWHAGVSAWRGNQGVNKISIGIEIVNPGHEWGYRPFPDIQMEAVAELSADILSRNSIPMRNVVAHSDIAPVRKEDPGELFNWQWLASQGVGLWPEVGDQGTGDRDQELQEIQEKLAYYGYEVPVNGVWDEYTKKVVMAFQRHFRPNNISGEWDVECASRLESLILLASGA